MTHSFNEDTFYEPGLDAMPFRGPHSENWTNRPPTDPELVALFAGSGLLVVGSAVGLTYGIFKLASRLRQ